MIVIISYLIPPLEIDHCLVVVSYRFIGMLLLFVAVIYDELLFLFVQSYVVVHDCYGLMVNSIQTHALLMSVSVDRD